MQRNIWIALFAAMSYFISLSAYAASDEAVETDISSREIAIESNFSGASLVVFGTVLNGRGAAHQGGDYDLAVVIRGPEQPVIARQKARILGIWINARSRPYQNVPGYYAVLSTRPLQEIAKPEVLKKFGIGFDSLLLERKELFEPGDPFRDAVVRIRKQEGLFRHSDTGVTFIGKSLFRATIDLPSNVPVGEYWADVFVFYKGKLVSNNSTSLNINKQGFERFVFTAAFDYPLLYGIAAVIAAILAGLLASAAFKKE